MSIKPTQIMKEKRKNTPAKTELRRLILLGDIMAGLIKLENKTDRTTAIANDWEDQVQTAREAGSFE